MKFVLLITWEVLTQVESLPRAQRRLLRRWIAEPGADPEKFTDYHEADAADRPMAVNVCGRHAIKYWVDQADRHIKVLHLSPADSSV